MVWKKSWSLQFSFSQNSFIFCFFLALKVSYRVQWESLFPHDLSLLKRLTIALENHLLNENHPQNKNENVVGVSCYTDAQSKWYRKKFVVSWTNWSLTVSPTALCKLGHKRVLLKKRKTDNFWKKKNGEGLEISPSTLGKGDEKKFQTFAMWSTQMIDVVLKNLHSIKKKEPIKA